MELQIEACLLSLSYYCTSAMTDPYHYSAYHSINLVLRILPCKMSDLIPRDQVPVLVQKLFDRTISTNHAPVPYISWVGFDVNILRRDWAAAPAVNIPGLAANEIDNTVASLKNISDTFLDRQPRGARGWGATLQEVHNWLRAAG